MDRQSPLGERSVSKRHYKDWLTAFVEYASYGEAPLRMYFWTGVSAMAGALRRQVWIDQKYFKWYANFYILLVAPPGIVSKSTTAGIGMDLLRKVPGVKFGPNVVTWQALVGAFAEASEAFELNGEYHTMSALTLESSELGNLLNPQDKQMIDLLVEMWDGKTGSFEKKTKHSGDDSVENPWINLIACTTPAWIAGNFPEYMIGGGFTSRTVFVYADEKRQYVAYPSLCVPQDHQRMKEKLIHDLEQISMLKGEVTLSPDAYEWGKDWYMRHYKTKPPNMDDERFGGYLARKQTHIHKLAIVVSASESDTLIVTSEHLMLADQMVTDLELDMPMVFSKIGRSDESFQVDRMLQFIRGKKSVIYKELYQHFHGMFPGFREFENMLAGLIGAGYVMKVQKGADWEIRAVV